MMHTPLPTTRVVLVTGTRTLARGFQAFAAEHGNIEAMVCTPQEVMFTVPESWHAVIVLLDAPPLIDFTVVQSLRKALPECRIVLWSDPVSVETAHQARSAGVHGVLYKDSSDELLQLCLKCVVAGELWFPRALMQGLLNVREVRLSPREVQLTDLISRGLSNKQIAAELQITEGTVKVYLCKLFRKTGVHDRYELALHGLRNLGVSGVFTRSQVPSPIKTLVVAASA